MDKLLFVRNIKEVCKTKGIKPTVACRESGVGTSFVNNIEVRGQVPSVEKVQKLATYLGVTTSELLGENIGPITVVEGGLNEDQQELVRLYSAAPSGLRRAMLESFRSAVRQGVGVDNGWAKVLSIEPGKVDAKALGIESGKVDAESLRLRQIKRLPMDRVVVRSKKWAKSRGKGRGGPARGR